MKKEDFAFDYKEDQLEDYWFKVKGESEHWLADRYGEMCMVGSTDVVYSKKDNIVAIRRQFPFSCDFVVSNDAELHDLLESIVVEMKV